METPDILPYKCGGTDEPAWPPQPTVVTVFSAANIPDHPVYTYREMQAHGAQNYAKGQADLLARQGGPAPAQGPGVADL